MHQKIEDLKKKSNPINYCALSVDKAGKLKERENLLSKRIVEGYASIWKSKNDYSEIFLRGAFKKSISENGPGSKANYQLKFRDEHGRACSLFEEIKEDEIGLYFKTVPLDDVTWSDDLLTQLRSGTINNFSIGFKRQWDMMEWDDEQDAIIVKECRLFEISAVAIPADMQTFAMRNIEEKEYVEDDVEFFINSLPRSKQFEARKLFTRCMTLVSDDKPLEEVRQALQSQTKPARKGIDYKFLTQNLLK